MPCWQEQRGNPLSGMWCGIATAYRGCGVESPLHCTALHCASIGTTAPLLHSVHAPPPSLRRAVFAEFESSVGRDGSKAQTMDGTVHPQCAHTLSVLRRLFTYPNVGVRQSLRCLPARHPLPALSLPAFSLLPACSPPLPALSLPACSLLAPLDPMLGSYV